MFKDCLKENRYALSVQGLARMQSSDFAVLSGLASRFRAPRCSLAVILVFMLAAQTAMPPS